MKKFGFLNLFVLIFTFLVALFPIKLSAFAQECGGEQRPGCPGFNPGPRPVDDNPDRRFYGNILFLVDSSSYMQYSLDNRFTFGDGATNDETGGAFAGVSCGGDANFKSSMQVTREVLRDFVLDKTINLGGPANDVDFALARFPKTNQPTRTYGHFPVTCGGEGNHRDRLVEVGAANFQGPLITGNSCPNGETVMFNNGCVGDIFLRAGGEDPRFQETGICQIPETPNILVGFPFMGWPTGNNTSGLLRWLDGYENSQNRAYAMGDFCKHSLVNNFGGGNARDANGQIIVDNEGNPINQREVEQNCELRANGRTSLGLGLAGVYDYFRIVEQQENRAACQVPKTVVVITSTWEQCGEHLNPESPTYPVNVVRQLRQNLGVTTYVLALGGLNDGDRRAHLGHDLNEWRARRDGLVSLAQVGTTDIDRGDVPGIRVPRRVVTSADLSDGLESIFQDIGSRIQREVCDDLDNDCDGFTDENLRNVCGECIERDGNGEVINAPVERCNFIDDDCDGIVDEASDEEGNLFTVGDDQDLHNLCGNCLGREDLTGEQIRSNLRQIQLMDDGYNDCRARAESGDQLRECEVNFAPLDEGVCRQAIGACPDDIAEVEGQPCGACGADGELGCVVGVLNCLGATQPQEEGADCDGEDNDCDGEIDEGLGCFCVPEGLEECDGEDDDCDGRTDEDTDFNACGLCGPTPLETCNDIDDDCDDQIDEGFDLNACGQCGEVPVEQCSGMDEDCDGAIDEAGCEECLDAQGNPREASDELCDGADNDCDGFIDEGGNALCNEGALGPDRCAESALGDIECIPADEPVGPGAGGEPGEGAAGEPGEGAAGEPGEGAAGAAGDEEPPFNLEDFCRENIDRQFCLDRCAANPDWDFCPEPLTPLEDFCLENLNRPICQAFCRSNPDSRICPEVDPDPEPGVGGEPGDGQGGNAVDPGNPGAGGDAVDPGNPGDGQGGFGQIPPGSDGQGGFGQIPPGSDGQGGNAVDPGNPGAGGDAVDPGNPGDGQGGFGQIPPGSDGQGGNAVDPGNPGAGGEAVDPGNPGNGQGGNAVDPGNPGAGGEAVDPANPGNPDPIDECRVDADCADGEGCVDGMCLTPEEENAYRAARQKSGRTGCGCSIPGGVDESDQKGTALLSLMVLLGLWRTRQKWNSNLRKL